MERKQFHACETANGHHFEHLTKLAFFRDTKILRRKTHLSIMPFSSLLFKSRKSE